MTTPDNSATDAKENTPETQAQYVQRLARDINEYNQIALFCGMATIGHQVPTVQLTLGNQHRTVLFLSAAAVLPALSAHGKRLQESLIAREIDTDELLRDVSKSLQILTKQTGG